MKFLKQSIVAGLALAFIMGCDGSPSASSSPKPLQAEPEPARQLSSRHLPTRYDGQIQSATYKFLGRSWPWERLWAQYYQESLHNPDAVSHANARGIAQFIPSTWDAISKEMGINASPHSARHAIQAGAYYMKKLYEGWISERPLEDRKRLSEASYNAGFGGVLGAQRRCGGAVLYEGIEPCLPSETQTYIVRIQHWLRLKKNDRSA